MILDKIKKAGDIKKISSEDYPRLAKEIRNFLVDKVSNTGGHLASNLGVVELTMALHLVFDLPKDKIVWDVGHQSYVHKILTGRKNEFDTLRQFEGMSGFPKRHESNCDSFDTGHSSTSVSAGLGMAYARDLQGEENEIISIIGDGALTGGMAYEALNNVSAYKGKFIIIINDNKMSISENNGGIPNLLNDFRVNESYIDLKEGVINSLNKAKYGDKLVDHLRKTKNNIKHIMLPSTVFEKMGIKYFGPIDGHDMDKLVRALTIAKKYKGPIILQIVTQKGKGYTPAEQNPEIFHGVGPFDKKTGKMPAAKNISYTSVFSKKLCDLAKKDEKIVAITASMPEGTGLKAFGKQFPERYFDVGIAEEHAVTFAAGLANGGLKPVVAIYSSFLQRAYDQILHDVCLQNLPVIFAIDRAGLVGADGETHQGIYDLSFLSIIPNLTVLAPKNRYELEEMLEYAVNLNKPVAIRYPRGNALVEFAQLNSPIEYGKSEIVKSGKDVAIIGVGNMFETAYTVSDRLSGFGYETTLVNARFVSPMDTALLDEIRKNHKLVVTIEDNIYTGGYGESVAAYLSKENSNCRHLGFAFPDKYIEHGTCEQLRKKYGLDSVSIFSQIINTINL